LREKLGGLPTLDSSIWVHAVSVGEVGAAIQLLKKLKTDNPGCRLILSTITDTGRQVALAKSPEGTNVVYLPFDLGFILRRSISRTNPRIFIVIETELWPNTFRTLSGRGIPVIVLNGRISDKSAGGYRKVSFFMRKVFSYVRFFGMQGEVDAQRLKSIGAPGERVEVIGNFKFDMGGSAEMPAWVASLTGPVIVAGSTHKGEEEMILSAYMENAGRFPGLKIILAPRHPERFGEVEAILKSSGIAYAKRSDIGHTMLPEDLCDKGAILLDTVGELSSVYGIADIAIIGKSFSGIGGQNPLEPAFWGKPIICGPHMENFPFVKDFYKDGAAFEVDAGGLAKKIKELLLSPEKARAAGEKAKEIYARNSGSVDRAVEIVRQYLR